MQKITIRQDWQEIENEGDPVTVVLKSAETIVGVVAFSEGGGVFVFIAGPREEIS